MTARTHDYQLYWVADNRVAADFPPVSNALREPDGLLAIGGDLSPRRLVDAYRRGIFPWYSEGQPILWWSPDPRCVLFPGEFRISRSLHRVLKKKTFRITCNRAFGDVIVACAQPRGGKRDTWITREVITAYQRLHSLGYAHSIECWHQGRLAGGLYGVAIGRVFFGESMFTRVTDASKAALAQLTAALLHWGYPLIDCQVYSRHLESLGARCIPRAEFVHLLQHWCAVPGRHNWRDLGGEP
jgi:leucyl/phenylalanyl-tRNA--protein transferase